MLKPIETVVDAGIHTVETGVRELAKVVSPVDRDLVKKLHWYRGSSRIAEDTITDKKIRGSSVYLSHLEPTLGTSASALLSSDLAGWAYKHKSGRYKGYVTGGKGGLGWHYQDWEDLRSDLGLPVSDEYEVSGGWRQDFERASLVASDNPWKIDRVATRQIDEADILAYWSTTGGKRFSEPLEMLYRAKPSRFGSEGVYMEFRDATNPNLHLHHAIIKITVGQRPGMVAFDLSEWQYYQSLGGTESALGFPLPMTKDVFDGETVIDFEGGEISYNPQDGFQHKVR